MTLYVYPSPCVGGWRVSVALDVLGVGCVALCSIVSSHKNTYADICRHFVLFIYFENAFVLSYFIDLYIYSDFFFYSKILIRVVRTVDKVIKE